MSAFCLAILLFYYVTTPVAELREKPDENSEVVSQGYFSEEVYLEESCGDWMKIRTTVDHYPGWTLQKNIHKRTTRFPTHQAVVAKVNRCAAHIYSVTDTIFGPILTLPFESQLEIIDPMVDSANRWIKVALPDGKIGFIQRGDVSINAPLLKSEELEQFASRFLDLPYTWGGRSSFGYDCSGFSQMLYRQMGISIPRDSKDQMAWEGFMPIAQENMQPGDLIFFGLSEDKIRHVGIYLKDQRFIHATVAENTPYIKISHLNEPEWNGSGRYTFRTFRSLKK